MGNFIVKQCCAIVIGAVIGGLAGVGLVTVVDAMLHRSQTSSMTAHARNAYTNVGETLVGTDRKKNMTLDGVAVGVDIDEAMPACKGNPKKTTVLCHGPLVRDDIFKLNRAEVFGFPVAKDRRGDPVVTDVWVDTKGYSTEIESVYADLSKAAPFNMQFKMIDSFGEPTRRDNDLEDLTWQMKGGQTVMLTGGDWDSFISLRTKN
ncbi:MULTISPECIES: hypothetical protein [Burkholderiaceae]|uniref:hypothetical protein n=1 Tax=Burkholderiaceae TaxID=119060 RepID=UPI0002A319BB|nr:MULTISPECIES: hypothetical protein [Burkholderiaceae]ELA00784.1 hypothetical protein D769_03200 [Cupriavidus sp. HMR-1]KVS16420.1 hypothetical protein WK32_27030 [Burkholderia vietnamiensis]MDR8057707.1 hypothetical protein [Burkholderia cenocepacia]MDR8062201.1 hypothetical protein [Burkholderia cenocepacia]